MLSVESRLDAKITSSGRYQGFGICGEEPEVPLLIKCKLTYPNIAKHVKIPPLVKWFYHDFNSSEYIKLSSSAVHTSARFWDICYLEDSQTYVCMYRHSYTCTPDFDGLYRCDVAVETTDGKESFFTHEFIVCKLCLFLCASGHSHSYLLYFCCCFVFSFVVDESYYFGQTILDCGKVSIIAFQARLFNASAVCLDWNITLTENSEGCISIVGHFIKVYTYEDFYSYQHNTPSNESPFEFPAKILDTKFTLPLNATYTVEKFYTFQVRTRYLEGSIYQTTKYKSEVFYFDKSGE